MILPVVVLADDRPEGGLSAGAVGQARVSVPAP